MIPPFCSSFTSAGFPFTLSRHSSNLSLLFPKEGSSSLLILFGALVTNLKNASYCFFKVSYFFILIEDPRKQALGFGFKGTPFWPIKLEVTCNFICLFVLSRGLANCNSLDRNSGTCNRPKAQMVAISTWRLPTDYPFGTPPRGRCPSQG